MDNPAEQGIATDAEACSHLGSVAALNEQIVAITARSKGHVELASKHAERERVDLNSFRPISEEEKDSPNAEIINSSLLLVEQSPIGSTLYKLTIHAEAFSVSWWEKDLNEEKVSAASVHTLEDWATINDRDERKRVLIAAIYHLADKISLPEMGPSIDDIESLLLYN